MSALLSNNATGVLASGITTTQTAIPLQTGQGALFPAPTSPSWFPVTIYNASGVFEICKCTGVSGDTLTVVRAREGTAGYAFASGAKVDCRMTAAAFANKLDKDTGGTIAGGVQLGGVATDALTIESNTISVPAALTINNPSGAVNVSGVLEVSGNAVATVAELDAVTGLGLQVSGQQAITGTETLVAASNAGALLLLETAGITINFPSDSATYWLSNVSSGDITLTFPTGTDFRTVIHAGEKVGLSGNGSGYYRIVAEVPLASAAPPTGSITAYAATSAPTGWLICDGSAVSRTTYAALFAVIGTTYGIGDGSTTFNLPNLLGKFIRGLDTVGSVDPGRAAGSSQTDAFQGHKFQAASGSFAITGSSTGTSVYDGNNNPNLTTATATGGPVTDGTNGTPRVAAETRPVNVAMPYIIKT